MGVEFTFMEVGLVALGVGFPVAVRVGHSALDVEIRVLETMLAVLEVEFIV